MKKIISLLLFLAVQPLAAQDAIDESMYKAYLTSEKGSAAWKQAVTSRMEAWKKDGRDLRVHFQLSIAQFGLLSSTMRYQDEDLFDEYYDQVVEHLEEIMEADKKWGEPHALLSAVYGLKMGYSPMQGMFLGSKSSNLTEKAKKLSPESPLVWKVHANSKFFTPEMWGGDIKEAVEAYEKCIALYEKNPTSLKFNWMYLDALAFMGQAYLKNGDTGKAIATYEKALAVEPQFDWVKFSLLPSAKSKAAK